MTPPTSAGQTCWFAQFTASERSDTGGYYGKNIPSLVLEEIWSARQRRLFPPVSV
jgi:hypothetical protein